MGACDARCESTLSTPWPQGFGKRQYPELSHSLIDGVRSPGSPSGPSIRARDRHVGSPDVARGPDRLGGSSGREALAYLLEERKAPIASARLHTLGAICRRPHLGGLLNYHERRVIVGSADERDVRASRSGRCYAERSRAESAARCIRCVLYRVTNGFLAMSTFPELPSSMAVGCVNANTLSSGENAIELMKPRGSSNCFRSTPSDT